MMSIPLFDYAPTSRNHRVANFEISGDEHSRIFNTDNLLSATEMDTLIEAAYRQVYNEQQMLTSHRQVNLESQLRSGQITVREFIRGLVLSDSFRRFNYEANNNYRLVQMCVQRILGRDVYSDREVLAWSIVIATQGLQGFIDALLTSNEYLENFGETTVPYQRRRILPQRSEGEMPFARMARYGDAHLTQLQQLGNDFAVSRTVAGMDVDLNWRPSSSARMVGAFLTYGFAGFLLLVVIGVFLSWFGWISI